MKPTDINNPNFFHRVVDCQWACPAHTNVPEYIRLIAQGRYDDAYMVNRTSNVFPGILGRTCDRPCEPACRRERVDGTPVAICRLKRVAADLKGDITQRLPKGAETANGKKVACVGAGPASLTVANDLLPLGYEVHIFETALKPGGLMRTNIPSFRLPEEVLDSEIEAIVSMGAQMHYGTEIASMKQLLDNGFDSIFVGSGAPRGKDLELEGRRDGGESRIHIGIDWLQSVAFGHVTEIGKRVLVIGVGNTAMDCCRTARRLGGKDVKIMARRPREYFKASPWELEDAEEEGIEIIVNHAPKRFVIDDGQLVGMEFDIVKWDESATRSQVLDTVIIPCDDVILAIGQENAFTWIERDIGIEFGKWDMPVVDEVTMQSTHPQIYFGGDAAFGPKNIIWAVAHGHEAAISIDNQCQGIPVSDRPPVGMNLINQKMGLTEWSYHNDFNPSPRQQMTHVDLTKRFEDLSLEVELGFSPEQTAREVERCLNCDVEPVFRAQLCIECDACIDVCPVQCLTITENREDELDLRMHLTAPAEALDKLLYVSSTLAQTGRIMVKDENICVHCGLCAERCPTAAWNMEKFVLQLSYAGTSTHKGH
ncbi:MAG: 4Fe-4S dicluster domain-containing protein [Actinomycetota bacterium]|nr:MAG: 4Fe-4S dicluster domain-containing protein [Actinomycetota bacterium]